MERTIRVKGKVRYCYDYMDNRINQKTRELYVLWFSFT